MSTVGHTSAVDLATHPLLRTDNPFFDHYSENPNCYFKTILFPGTKNVFQKECFPFECRCSMAISCFLEKKTQ